MTRIWFDCVELITPVATGSDQSFKVGMQSTAYNRAITNTKYKVIATVGKVSTTLKGPRQ